MTTDKIIAMDIDGMFGSFIDAALTRWYRLTGQLYHHDSIDDYKMEISLGLSPDEVKRFIAMVEQPGFCSSIPMYEGAQDAMYRLSRLGEVFAVTAPTASATWARERELWLEHNFGIDRNHVISTTAKHLVYADVFGEDSYSTLKRWKTRHLNSAAVLLSRRYNRHQDMTGIGARVETLDELVQAVDAALSGQRLAAAASGR